MMEHKKAEVHNSEKHVEQFKIVEFKEGVYLSDTKRKGLQLTDKFTSATRYNMNTGEASTVASENFGTVKILTVTTEVQDID